MGDDDKAKDSATEESQKDTDQLREEVHERIEEIEEDQDGQTNQGVG